MIYDFDAITERRGTDSVKWDHDALKGRAPDIIPMTIADMDFPAPPFVTEAIVERARHGVFGYTVVPDSYYAALTGWLAKKFSWEVKKDWIRTSPGVIPALNFAVQAYTDPGDGVIIHPPVYHPFRFAIENNKRVVLNNPLKREDGGYAMDIKGLREIIDDRTRMIVISSPHNPVGRVWEADELLELAEICLERNIIIISDEIHCDLVMPGRTHTPTATLSEEIAGITVTCTSPSKTFNLAELQVANIIIPNLDLFLRFDEALSRAGIGRPNVLGAVACEAAYSKGAEWVAELIQYIHENFLFLKDFLAENLPEAEATDLEGTYLGWCDFSAFGNEEVVEKRLLTEAGVALTPGSIFGPGGEGFFRINLATPRAILEKALKGIRKTLRG